jgi:leader peptidase (prepilin peptidase)/N-methyltransferase
MALLALSAIDLEHRLLPDAITYPGIILGLVLALLLPHLTFLEALLGVLLGGGFFFLIGRVYEKLSGRTGMGGGDVKLLAMIGAFLGAYPLPYIIFVSAALGTIAGVAQVLAGGGPWRTARIPFGPFLAAAALIYLFAGDQILIFFGL